MSFCVLFVAYGHAGLPLLIAAPGVWVNWSGADLAMRWMAGGAAVGAGAFLVAFVCGPDGSRARVSSVIAIGAFLLSAAIVWVVTEVFLLTAVTSVPFLTSVGGLVASALRKRQLASPVSLRERDR